MENLVEKMQTELMDLFDEECDKLFKDKAIRERCDKYHQYLSINIETIHDASFIRKERDRLRKLYGDDKKDDFEKAILEMIEDYTVLSPQEPAMSVCSWYSAIPNDDPDKKEIIFLDRDLTIYMSIDEFYHQAFLNLDRLDDVLAFNKLILRHEMGHIRDYISQVGTPTKQWKKQNEADEKKKKEVLVKLEEFKHRMLPLKDIGYASNLMYYNEIPAEKRANEQAGFTPEELELLYNQYNLN